MRGEVRPHLSVTWFRPASRVNFDFSSLHAIECMFSRWNLPVRVWARGIENMLSRWGCVVAICFGLAPRAEAAESSGLIHRASCSIVRFYGAKFSASAAEMWARSHGATEAEIEAARHCLKAAPAQ